MNADGTVTFYAVTSTVSNAADQGIDPNRLVGITDTLAFTTGTQAANEQFATLETASFGDVLRGVSFAPNAVPEPGTVALMLGGLGIGGVLVARGASANLGGIKPGHRSVCPCLPALVGRHGSFLEVAYSVFNATPLPVIQACSRLP